MVGFSSKPTKTVEGERTEEVDQDPKVKSFKDPLDFSFTDSFLDFDSINWLGSNWEPDEFTLEDTEFEFFEDGMEMGQEGISKETSVESQTTVVSESIQVKSEHSDDTSERIGVRSESVVSDMSRVTDDGPEAVVPSESENVESAPVASSVMNVDEAELKKTEEGLASSIEVGLEKVRLTVDDTSERIGAGLESVVSDLSRVTDDGPEADVPSEFENVDSVPVASSAMIVDEAELKKTEEGLASSIEVGSEKVCFAVVDDQKIDEAKNETSSSESESEVSSSSSSSSKSSSKSSSSSSSCEEETDEEVEMKEGNPEAQVISRKEVDVSGELEEGEIKSVDEEDDGDDEEDDDNDDDGEDDDADVMIAWSDNEDEEILGAQTKGPIRSKNELEKLPLVPAVNVTLEPHHAMLPVGVVLSVLGTQVIVEGVEKHNPLNEGSIIWITEKRAPLGLVDEIFGPVKNPFYIVRFNSESEVPEGINQGMTVSFVAEFADHVLNDKNLYKKGYDASGENDEEIPEEAEFSDDEKEAEYRRMQKMAKRGMNEQKPGKNNKKKNRDPGRYMNRYSPQQTENQTAQQTALPNMLSLNHSDSPMPSMVARTGVGMGSLAPHLQPHPQIGGFAPNNLANRAMTPTGFPPNAAAWNSQANQQNQYQLPSPNQMSMPNLVPMHQMP